MAGKKNGVSVQGGFTLLELLVVMFIVVLAVAILYPVFAQVREKGRQAVCMSYVSQHARAVLMYADDHDERLPIAWNRFSTKDSEETLYPQWWNVVQPYLGDKDAFHCPDDMGYAGMRPGDPFNDQPFYPTIGSSYTSFLGWLPSSASSAEALSSLDSLLPRKPGGLGGLHLAAILDASRTALSYDSWPYWHSEVRDPRLEKTTDAITVHVSFLDGGVRRRSTRYLAHYLNYGPNAAEEAEALMLGDLPLSSPEEPVEVTAASGSTSTRSTGSQEKGKPLDSPDGGKGKGAGS